MTNSLMQNLKEPTRQQYLLDLCLTDMDEVTARVLPCIADHHCVLAECTFLVDVFPPSRRSVWKFRSADWSAMCEHVALLDFSFVDHECVDTAAQRLTDMLLSVCDSFVTRRVLLERSCSHPWLIERCRNAVAVGQAAFGTDNYAAQCLLCTVVLKEEFSCYVLV